MRSYKITTVTMTLHMQSHTCSPEVGLGLRVVDGVVEARVLEEGQCYAIDHSL